MAPDRAGLISAAGLRFDSHRVNRTLAADNVPSTTIDAAASAKKLTAVAWCADSHQPTAATNTSRAVCANTGPRTFAAPCEEKYIEIESPMKAYIGAAVDKYCRLAARTPGSLVNISTQRSGKIAMMVPTRPTDTNDTQPAVHAIRRARVTRSAPIAIPIIGTDAMPTANAIEVSMNSSRAPMPYPARISVPNCASIWVNIVIVSTDCSGEKQETAPTFRMSKNMPR